MLIYSVETIEEYISTTISLGKGWDDHDNGAPPDLWYRGVEDRNWPLVPGAYRKDLDPCDEGSMFLSFMAMSPSYLAKTPVDKWEWYFLMQHYGLPTRLLDWSESPLFALYFALTDAGGNITSCRDASGKERVPAIWVIEPSQINETLHEKSKRVVYTAIDDKKFKQWLPPKCAKYGSHVPVRTISDVADNRNPVAIFPKRLNPRIVAQMGTFTVHGTDPDPLDKIIESCPNGKDARIARIDIAPAACKEMYHALRVIGIKRMSVFPEPNSMAQDLRFDYGVGKAGKATGAGKAGTAPSPKPAKATGVAKTRTTPSSKPAKALRGVASSGSKRASKSRSRPTGPRARAAKAS